MLRYKVLKLFATFQQLIRRLDEILYLSRNRLLRKKKKKKISENHEKTITSSISVNNNKLAMADDNFSGNPQSRDLVTEEDEEVARLDKLTGSVSQYSSARESLHSEYMAVILAHHWSLVFAFNTCLSSSMLASHCSILFSLYILFSLVNTFNTCLSLVNALL